MSNVSIGTPSMEETGTELISRPEVVSVRPPCTDTSVTRYAGSDSPSRVERNSIADVKTWAGPATSRRFTPGNARMTTWCTTRLPNSGQTKSGSRSQKRQSYDEMRQL